MSDDTMKALKAEADSLGIKYHVAIKEETLEERIALHKREAEDMIAVDKKEEKEKEESQKKPVQSAMAPESDAMKAAKEANKLIRCTIAPMNPQERDLSFRMFDCGNKYTGKIAKVIPFNKPWHVPQMILDFIKEQRFLTARMTRTETGKEVMQQNWAPSYAVNILDPLTNDELKHIAASQGTLVEE